MALVTPVNVAEVTFLSTTGVTLSAQSTDALMYQPKTLSPKLEDIIYDEGMKKGDFVIVSRDYYSDDDKLVIAEKTSGTVAGVKGSSPITDYQVDGTWYNVAKGYTAPTTIKSGRAWTLWR